MLSLQNALTLWVEFIAIGCLLRIGWLLTDSSISFFMGAFGKKDKPN